MRDVSSASERADLAACRESLRNGSRTFLAASMLLPRKVHEPASALYAFCRLADDKVDDLEQRGDGSEGAVAGLRRRLVLAYAGTPMDDPADRALACVVRRHSIPFDLFDALLEGFEWDLQGRRYETLQELHDYAARVAGTVGAMMALLMGVRSAEGLARACDLGVAMQLSNIARDVGEDARMGRLYLPREWMLDEGIDPDDWLARPVFNARLAKVVARLLDAADVLYDRVCAGVARLPLACRPGINAARFIYAEIGREVARRGYDSVSERARVSGQRKLALVLKSLLHLAPSTSSDQVPPIDATRFLVEAAVGSATAAGTPPIGSPTGPRGVVASVVWTMELFARLEQQENLRSSGRSAGSGIA